MHQPDDDPRQTKDELKRFAACIRQVGLKRVLYGSDLGPPYARQEWLTFRTTVPLTDDEMRTIATNVAPYFLINQTFPERIESIHGCFETLAERVGALPDRSGA
jgi:hypothetical protein